MRMYINKESTLDDFIDQFDTTQCKSCDEILDVYNENGEVCKSKTLKEMFIENLSLFISKEQEILKLRLGFEDGVCRSREELSEQFGVSPKDIAQIELKAKLQLNLRNFQYTIMECFKASEPEIESESETKPESE